MGKQTTFFRFILDFSAQQSGSHCFSLMVYFIGRDRYMVQSIPGELSLHETLVLTVAAKQPDGMAVRRRSCYKKN